MGPSRTPGSPAARRSQAPGPSLADGTRSAPPCPLRVPSSTCLISTWLPPATGSSLPSPIPALRSRSSGLVNLLMELRSAARGASPSPPVVGPTPRRLCLPFIWASPRWPGVLAPQALCDRPVETGLLDAPLSACFLAPGSSPSPVGWSSQGQECRSSPPSLGATLPLARGGAGDRPGPVGGTWGLLRAPIAPLSQGLAGQVAVLCTGQAHGGHCHGARPSSRPVVWLLPRTQ